MREREEHLLSLALNIEAEVTGIVVDASSHWAHTRAAIQSRAVGIERRALLLVREELVGMNRDVAIFHILIIPQSLVEYRLMVEILFLFEGPDEKRNYRIRNPDVVVLLANPDALVIFGNLVLTHTTLNIINTYPRPAMICIDPWHRTIRLNFAGDLLTH
jgi:hypothetical protein